ncbi:MAG: serine--tRNA ligase [Candidatus Parcubacteria bacterium]|nr:MAG: serine--tRNA ligase [Candidatus Parcubacteria bacterium]
MIDLKDLLRNPEMYKQNMKERNFDPSLVDEIIEIKTQINSLIKDKDDIRSFINKYSKTKPDEKIIEEIKNKKEKLKTIEAEIKKLENELEERLELVPNLKAPEVPVGEDETENVVIKTWGEISQFNFQPKDHVELGKIYDLIDIERAGKVTGSRFYYLKNEAVLLEFALINFVYDISLKQGFIPIIPPVFIKEKYYRGMGRLNKVQKEERYYLPQDDLYLVGSAEHTVGPYFAEEILNEKDLPKRFLGFSTCFRREAGSYGKDVRGILRTHQFDKVEMFSFTLPEKSEEEHQFLLSLQEKIMQELKLPYRVVLICSGDLGFTDYKQYDIETWFPGQNKYRETHSCSNTTDFQSRGINARFRRQNGKIEYLHMLNATAIAIGRILIAIFENYQRKNYIEIPEVLIKYTGFEKIMLK